MHHTVTQETFLWNACLGSPQVCLQNSYQERRNLGKSVWVHLKCVSKIHTRNEETLESLSGFTSSVSLKFILGTKKPWKVCLGSPQVCLQNSYQERRNLGKSVWVHLKCVSKIHTRNEETLESLSGFTSSVSPKFILGTKKPWKVCLGSPQVCLQNSYQERRNLGKSVWVHLKCVSKIHTRNEETLESLSGFTSSVSPKFILGTKKPWKVCLGSPQVCLQNSYQERRNLGKSVWVHLKCVSKIHTRNEETLESLSGFTSSVSPKFILGTKKPWKVRLGSPQVCLQNSYQERRNLGKSVWVHLKCVSKIHTRNEETLESLSGFTSSVSPKFILGTKKPWKVCLGSPQVCLQNSYQERRNLGKSVWVHLKCVSKIHTRNEETLESPSGFTSSVSPKFILGTKKPWKVCLGSPQVRLQNSYQERRNLGKSVWVHLKCVSKIHTRNEETLESLSGFTSSVSPKFILGTKKPWKVCLGSPQVCLQNSYQERRNLGKSVWVHLKCVSKIHTRNEETLESLSGFTSSVSPKFILGRKKPWKVCLGSPQVRLQNSYQERRNLGKSVWVHLKCVSKIHTRNEETLESLSGFTSSASPKFILGTKKPWKVCLGSPQVCLQNSYQERRNLGKSVWVHLKCVSKIHTRNEETLESLSGFTSSVSPKFILGTKKPWKVCLGSPQVCLQNSYQERRNLGKSVWVHLKCVSKIHTRNEETLESLSGFTSSVSQKFILGTKKPWKVCLGSPQVCLQNSYQERRNLGKSVWVHLKCVSKIHTRNEETLESLSGFTSSASPKFILGTKKPWKVCLGSPQVRLQNSYQERRNLGKSVWVHLKCVSKIHTRNEETLESLSGFTSSASPKFILGTKKPWKVCLGSPQVRLQNSYQERRNLGKSVWVHLKCVSKIHTRNEETLESLSGFTSSVSPKFILGTKKPWKVCLGSPQVRLQNSYQERRNLGKSVWVHLKCVSKIHTRNEETLESLSGFTSSASPKFILGTKKPWKVCLGSPQVRLQNSYQERRNLGKSVWVHLKCVSKIHTRNEETLESLSRFTSSASPKFILGTKKPWKVCLGSPQVRLQNSYQERRNLGKSVWVHLKCVSKIHTRNEETLESLSGFTSSASPKFILGTKKPWKVCLGSPQVRLQNSYQERRNLGKSVWVHLKCVSKIHTRNEETLESLSGFTSSASPKFILGTKKPWKVCLGSPQVRLQNSYQERRNLGKSVWVHLKCVSKLHTRNEETLESLSGFTSSVSPKFILGTKKPWKVCLGSPQVCLQNSYQERRNLGKSVWVHLKCVSKIHTRNEETLESLSGFTSSASPKFILGTKKPWKFRLGSPQVCLQNSYQERRNLGKSVWVHLKCVSKIHTRNEETLESLSGFTSSVSPKFILGTKKPWKVCLGSPQVCLQNSYQERRNLGKSVWVHLKCVSKIHTRNEETLESLSGFTSSASLKFILGTKKPWKVCLGSPQVRLQNSYQERRNLGKSVWVHLKCVSKIHTRNEETLESLSGFTSSVSPKFILGTKKPWKVRLGSPQVRL